MITNAVISNIGHIGFCALIQKLVNIVEEMFKKNKYCMLVLKNKVISCIKKIPTTITSARVLTISELISVQNKKRLPEFDIKLGSVALTTLKKQCIKTVRALGLTFGDIDLMSVDMTKDNDYVIIKVNSNPAYIINEKIMVTNITCL